MGRIWTCPAASKNLSFDKLWARDVESGNAAVYVLFHINGHEADLDLPGLPQRVKEPDKKWAEGTKPINVIFYDLFLIKKAEKAEKDRKHTNTNNL